MTLALTSLMVALGTAGVGVLTAAVFLESGVLIGFFLPGDGLLFTGGLLVASGHIDLPIWVVVTVVTLAAILGDQVGYTSGRRLGPRVFRGRGSRLLKPEHVAHAERFFAAHGSKAVVLARFVPVVRTLTPFLAGMTAMPRRRFSAYNAGGGVVWAAGIILVGYFLGGVPLIADHLELIIVGVVAASVVPLVLTLVQRRRSGAARRRSSAAPSRAPGAAGS